MSKVQEVRKKGEEKKNRSDHFFHIVFCVDCLDVLLFDDKRKEAG